MKTWATIGRALRNEQRCALVSIVEARGSAPREPGARMVVLEDGSFAGTIGGGTLEWQAIARARDALAKGGADGDAPPVGLERMALGPDLGQCCGGSVRILLEVFTPGRSAEVQALTLAESEGLFATEGRIAGRRVERTILDRAPDGGEDSALAADGRLLERFGAQKQVLALIGAGHVGRAVILALAPLDFSVTWIDPRDDGFPSVVPGDVRTVVAAAPAAELDAAPDGAFVLVMSHSHALDFDVVHAALRARRFGYVGLIGSASKKARFVSRMRQAGLGEGDIARLVCPIGIDGIESKQPAVIAASVVADLLRRRDAMAVAAQSAEASSR
ncbi:MAG: xanthine dehydrogenase accessory protein XdhC [Rhodospirillales bacterium]|nr:xanthine dehydrogenase accessory protein XdhC [Rhodospirillales bacterium]MDE0379083.1 xanthine dehydrogenase accessory protein XdhC [Rhodospirillales bacterium]